MKIYIFFLTIIFFQGCATAQIQYKEGVHQKSIVKEFSIVKHRSLNITGNPSDPDFLTIYNEHIKISGKIDGSLGVIHLDIIMNGNVIDTLDTNSQGFFEKIYDFKTEQAPRLDMNSVDIAISRIGSKESEIFSKGKELVVKGPLSVNTTIDSAGNGIQIRQKYIVPAISKTDENMRDRLDTKLEDQIVSGDVVILKDYRLFSEKNLAIQQQEDKKRAHIKTERKEWSNKAFEAKALVEHSKEYKDLVEYYKENTTPLPGKKFFIPDDMINQSDNEPCCYQVPLAYTYETYVGPAGDILIYFKANLKDKLVSVEKQ